MRFICIIFSHCPKSISTRGPLNALPALFIKTDGHPYFSIASLTQFPISKVLDKSNLRSEPLLFYLLDLPLPPPNPSPKKSSNISEKLLEKSKFPNPPLPPPPFSKAACPKLS